ncbi:hypothetical protein TKK_0005083 [Trichogramma kaykai]
MATTYVKLKDAIATIPKFDRATMSLEDFLDSIEYAKEIIDSAEEALLVKLVRTKIGEEARKGLKDIDIKTVAELKKQLRGLYSSGLTVSALQGLLAQQLQQPGESVLSFATKIRDLGNQIIQTKKLSLATGATIPKDFEENVKGSQEECFRKGLLDNISVRMKSTGSLTDLIKEAITIEKDLEVKSMMRRKLEKRCGNCGRTNHATEQCRVKRVNTVVTTTNNTHSNAHGNTSKKICTYCKKPGHLVDKCFKYVYDQVQKAKGSSKPPADSNAQSPCGLSQKKSRIGKKLPSSSESERAGDEQRDEAAFSVNHVRGSIAERIDSHSINSLPYIRFVVENQPNIFLIDSGSEVNLITESTIPTQTTVHTNYHFILNGVNSQEVETLGSVGLKINNDLTQFLVVGNNFPINFNGLFGAEFLLSNKAKIDFGKQQLTLNNLNIKLHFEDTPLNKPSKTAITNFQITGLSKFTPYLRINIFKIDSLFLLDTGAQISLININLLPLGVTIVNKGNITIEGIEKRPKMTLGYAIGGVLSQGEVGKDRPIAFTSRALRGPELNYEVYEKEALAIIHSVEQFHSYIYNRKITIYTNHQPLVWFKTADLNTRVQKWRFKLSVYDYSVVYKKGKTNVNADSLSRNVPESPTDATVCTVTRSKANHPDEQNDEASCTEPSTQEQTIPKSNQKKKGRPPKHLQKPKPFIPPRDSTKRQTKQTQKFDPSIYQKQPEPDPKSFPIPPSDSENSVESDQESESENEQQNEPIDATSAQPSEKSNSTTNNKIVYSKGLMHCMDGNIAYFIDDQGQPVDEGARKLHEFNKLPKFSNISIGEVSFEVNKRVNHFALCIKEEKDISLSACKGNIKNTLFTLEAILKKREADIIFFTKSETIQGLPWSETIECISNAFQKSQIKIVIFQDNAEGDQEHRSHPPIPERKNVGTRAFDQHQDEEEAS